jgi:hypothetical protein
MYRASIYSSLRSELLGNRSLISTIQQFNSSTVQQFNSSTVQQFNSSTVQQFNSSTVQRFNDSSIEKKVKEKQFTLGIILSQIPDFGLTDNTC